MTATSYRLGDTIAAVASGPGGAPRGIVRLSGPLTLQVLRKLTVPEHRERLQPVRSARRLALKLQLPAWQVPLEAWVFLWPEGRSYTREPAAEVHTWGSPPVLQTLLEELCRAGARPAAPGEFTLRAFLSGRLDLAQAEAVLGVIQAQDPRQLQTALDQLAGGVGRLLLPVQEELLELLAHVEAGLDFVEEDIQFISPDELARQLGHLLDRLRQLQRQFQQRRRAEARYRVVLSGSPNVGKSSLFAALTGQAVLVSPTPGTTRDYLQAELTWEGVPLVLVDTAGAEAISAKGQEGIEAQAQHLARQQQKQADLVLFCLDSTRKLNAWEQEQLARLGPQAIVVWTKADLAPPRPFRPPGLSDQVPAVATSSRTGEGLEELRRSVVEKLHGFGSSTAAVIPATAARGAEALGGAVQALEEALRLVQARDPEELVAAALRSGADWLGQVLGTVYTDDILDRIFSRFCIGK